MILINPPVAKPSEPPAGIALLSGALTAHGVKHTVLDASIEGLRYLLRSPRPHEADDAWSRRAFRTMGKNLSVLKDRAAYRQLARYTKAVKDLGRVLEIVSGRNHAAVGLANYGHETLSPLRSRDLIFAAEHPEEDVFYPYFRTRLAELIAAQQPQWIGFSLNYLSQALCTFSMIGFVRREFPDIKIIIGGGLATSWIKSPLWRDHFSGLVEHFVAGPGEDKLLTILGKAGKETPYLPDFQSLPAGEYLSPGSILPYSGSSGCYWNRCNFCPEKAEANPYHPVPAEKVISDLAILAQQAAPSLIHLLDSAVSPALMEAITVKGPLLPWYGFARISRHLTDPDFCRSLKRSGCVMLKLGLESGDQDVLDAMEKGISLAMASEALHALKLAGIATYVYLIFGTPAETLPGARKTLGFIADHAECIHFMNLAIFNMPLSGAASHGLDIQRFSDADLSLYTDFAHPRGWDRKQVRLFLENEFKRHPAVSAILKQDPPVFTSNHAPLFVMKDETDLSRPF
ncbi:MAG: radical SAM protein [Nitrospirae bacterium]|nr:MAG: radical SAM protein [Nitrospirota bacterium]